MSGKVLTWGVGDKGALGLGNPALLPPGAPGGYSDDGGFNVPEVKMPTEVRFDHGRASPKDRFCFSIAAAGWHTGALVIDLEVRCCAYTICVTECSIALSMMKMTRMKR